MGHCDLLASTKSDQIEKRTSEWLNKHLVTIIADHALYTTSYLLDSYSHFVLPTITAQLTGSAAKRIITGGPIIPALSTFELG
jgi:hypothetical protein